MIFRKQSTKTQLESSLAEARSALSAARQDYSEASTETITLSRRVAALEGRLAAKEAEANDLAQQLADLRHTKVGLERASAMDSSKLSLELQVLALCAIYHPHATCIRIPATAASSTRTPQHT